jgi:uncharacterized membrane protein
MDAIQLGNIAVLSKAPDGSVAFWETDEVVAARRETTFGAVTGWLLGLVGVFVGAPLGPAYGGMAGEALGASEPFNRDHGFSDEQLRLLAERLNAGSSLLLTLVRPEEAAVVEQELQRLGGQTVQQTLAPELLARLTADR